MAHVASIESNGPLHPGRRISRLIGLRGWTQKDLAEKTGYSRASINQTIKGRTPITNKMAVRLSEVLDIDPSELLEQQSRFDEWLLENKTREAILKTTNVMRFPDERRQSRDVSAVRMLATPLVDHQIESAIEERDISIDPFQEICVQPASYDLTVGKKIVMNDGSAPISLDEDDFVDLLPGAAALVQTQESIRLGGRYLARIGATSTLARHAIFISTGLQVDPGYEGRLFVSLANMGSRPFRLQFGESFLSLEIHRLPIEPRATYHGRYQHTREIPSSLERVMMPNKPVIEIDEDGRALVSSLGDDALSLFAPLTISTHFDSGQYTAILIDLDLEASGDSPIEAVEALVERLLIRFAVLANKPGFNKSENHEVRWYKKHINDRRFISFEHLLEIAGRLDGDFSAFEETRVVTVTDGCGREIMLDIPKTGRISTEKLAELLQIPFANLLALIDQEADSQDFLRWTSKKISPE